MGARTEAVGSELVPELEVRGTLCAEARVSYIRMLVERMFAAPGWRTRVCASAFRGCARFSSLAELFSHVCPGWRRDSRCEHMHHSFSCQFYALFCSNASPFCSIYIALLYSPGLAVRLVFPSLWFSKHAMPTTQPIHPTFATAKPYIPHTPHNTHPYHHTAYLCHIVPTYPYNPVIVPYTSHRADTTARGTSACLSTATYVTFGFVYANL